jgi:hypothetical protein
VDADSEGMVTTCTNILVLLNLQRTVIVTPELGYGQKGLNEIPVS